MYKITIKLPIDFNKDNLKIHVAKEVRLKVPDISKWKLLKLSLDARDKNKIFYLASICFETFKNLNLKKFKGVSKFEKKEIHLTIDISEMEHCVILCRDGQRIKIK